METESTDTEKIMEAMEHLDRASVLMRGLIGAKSVAGQTVVPRDEDFLDRSLHDIDFGVYTVRLRALWDQRTYRGTKKIETVRELCTMTENECLMADNIGHKCVDRVKVVLAAHGLRLGLFDPPPSPTIQETRDQKELRRLRAMMKALVDQGVGSQEWANAYNKMMDEIGEHEDA